MLPLDGLHSHTGKIHKGVLQEITMNQFGGSSCSIKFSFDVRSTGSNGSDANQRIRIWHLTIAKKLLMDLPNCNWLT